MDRIGSALQRLYWWEQEGMACFRDQKLHVSVLQLVTLPLGLPLFLVGIVAKKVHALCGGGAFRVYGQARGGGDGKSFLQWNVCAMPGGLCKWFGGMRPARRRVEGVFAKIVERRPLVVGLMEAHDEEFVRPLGRKLASAGYRVVDHVGDCLGLGTLGSGLMFATKARVVKLAFHRFTSFGGCQGAIAKGFLVADLDHEGEEFRVIVTHLDPGSADARAAQIEQIRKHWREGCVVLGDLNIERGSETIDLGHDPGCGKTCKGESIDYILGVDRLEVVDGKGLSDHQILFGS